MSTVLSRPASFHPAGNADAMCIGCQTALSVPASQRRGDVMCRVCQRSQAANEAARLMFEIRDLREGKGIYSLLTEAERSEQLVAIGLPSIGRKPRFPAFRTMPNDRLIAIVADSAQKPDATGEALAELCARLDHTPPSADERAELEERDEIETRVLIMDGDAIDAEKFDGLS